MEIAEPLLYDLTTGPSMSEPSSVYVGGDFRHKADSDTLMGGGGSFSSGGSGKGMHSRLYLRVLNHHQEADSFSAFSSVYNDFGLFGIYLVIVSHLLRMYLKLIDSEGLSVVGDCYSWASYGVGAASGKECYQICCFNELGIKGMMKSLDFAIHVYHNVTGDVICHGDKSVIKEGHKSFPSGHASCLCSLKLSDLFHEVLKSFSGNKVKGWLLFLLLNIERRVLCWPCFSCIILIGKIRACGKTMYCFFLPLLVAALVGVSRVDDYWHHWQDVFAVGLLGL
ncbi:hypothetical protein H6P81_013353 [Aristolochia fimbriata]|uniref:Peptidase M16 C-terminal domain-containing protein n=1 Tax=Aristolochia fimbriata TaxID=158543 RepID=A0AAV7EEG7_ARIFI|nr:hypothetical protein H6P81_013353 [Aristolochia fimbriata]